MSELWRWLLGLERLSPSDAGVEFGFAHALPLWAWALIALAAVAVAWRSYTRLEGARWARFGLGLLRSALLVLLALLIAGPVRNIMDSFHNLNHSVVRRFNFRHGISHFLQMIFT